MFELDPQLLLSRSPTQLLRDAIDIIIVAWVVYRALLVLRGTRAIQMAVGLGIVSLVYLIAKALKFATLLSLLSSLLSSIVLIVVVVFQNDIRRALIRMGQTAWGTSGREQQSRVIDEVVAAATELARHRMGALIAFEQDANILEFTKSEGIPLECVVTRELLVSLFVPESVNKLHDGAVLIRDLKIARAGVFFPMPDTKVIDAQLGSRHRAALGITEETDAMVVVVSEERGTISFCFSGNIVQNLDGQSLRLALLGLFGGSARKKAKAKKAAANPTPVAPVPQPPGRTTSPSAGVAPRSVAAPVTATPATASVTSASIPPPAMPKAGTATKMATSTPMRPAEPRPPMDSVPPGGAGPVSTRSPTFVPQASVRTTTGPRPIEASKSGADSDRSGSGASKPPGDDS